MYDKENQLTELRTEKAKKKYPRLVTLLEKVEKAVQGQGIDEINQQIANMHKLSEMPVLTEGLNVNLTVNSDKVYIVYSNFKNRERSSL